MLQIISLLASGVASDNARVRYYLHSAYWYELLFWKLFLYKLLINAILYEFWVVLLINIFTFY